MTKYKTNDKWICSACGKENTVTEEGVRCSGPGHSIYRSLIVLNDEYDWRKRIKKDQLTLF